MIRGAADPGVTPDLLWGFLPKPVAVALAVVLAITYVITEVTGKLNGPLSKLLARRTEKREQQVPGWRERDRRVEELTQTLELVNGQVAYLTERVHAQGRELNICHRTLDAQYRAIRTHIGWDNTWVPRARRAGIDIPDPPDLYVYLSEEAPS